MKYVEDLVPSAYRVLLPTAAQESAPRPVGEVLATLLSITCGGAALWSVWSRPLQALLIVLIGLLFLPHAHRVVERALRFHWTWPIKGACLVLLSALLVPVVSQYRSAEALHAQQLARAAQLAAERERREREEAERREQARRDSLAACLAQADGAHGKKRGQVALAALGRALAFAREEKAEILRRRGVLLLEQKAYDSAIAGFSEVLAQRTDAEVFLLRARSFAGKGDRRSAATDAKQALDLGHAEAQKLYDRVNPIKRRLVETVTLCCDGGHSYAKGRGACSHHSGVCDWNYPIYQEYREY